MNPPPRDVSPDEWRPLRDLRLAALQGAPLAFLDRYDEAVAREDTYWQEFAQRAIVVVDVADGSGFAGMAGTYVDAAGAGAIWGVWVDPPHRGSGLADALLEACEQRLRDRGFAHAVLQVHEHNVRARRVYERRGYSATGRTDPFPPDPTTVEVELAKPL